MRHFTCVAFALLLVVPVAAQGQQVIVRGTVRDSASGEPIQGAVITAVAAADSTLGRTTTALNGEFALRLTGPLPMTLRVIRLGFRPGRFRVNGAAHVEIRLARLPPELDTMRTNEKRTCPEGPKAEAAYTLWARASAAYRGASAWLDQHPPMIRLLRFRRTLTPVPPFYRRRFNVPPVADQQIRTVEGSATAIFPSRRSPSDFATGGYLTTDRSGDVLFPLEAAVLFDATFLRTHCLKITDDHSTRPGELAIDFTPIKRRDGVVEVQGTFWLDSTDAAPISAVYSFTDLPLAEKYTPPSGTLQFARMPSGTTLVVGWALRHKNREDRAGIMRREPNNVRQGYVFGVQNENGAQLARATWPDGTSWAAPLATLTGRIVNSRTGDPVPGERVALLNAGQTAVSDSAGVFVIHDLMDGPYVLALVDTAVGYFHHLAKMSDAAVTAAHGVKPAEDVFDDDHPHSVVVLGRVALGVDSTPTVTIRVPQGRAALQRYCGARRDTRNSGVLALHIRDGANAAKRVRLVVPATAAAPTAPITAQLDDQGRAILCHLPVGVPIRVSATGDSGTPLTGTVEINPASGVAVLLLSRDPPPTGRDTISRTLIQ